MNEERKRHEMPAPINLDPAGVPERKVNRIEVKPMPKVNRKGYGLRINLDNAALRELALKKLTFEQPSLDLDTFDLLALSTHIRPDGQVRLDVDLSCACGHKEKFDLIFTSRASWQIGCSTCKAKFVIQRLYGR